MAFPSPAKPLALATSLTFLIAGVVHFSVNLSRPTVEDRHGAILHETRSSFSQIRVRELGTVRSLHFIDAKGIEQCQSAIDLAAPGSMKLGYTRGLFASLLYRHPQDRVLIVGLGGGGMVRFLNEAFPTSMVEAVEIDPVVVGIAAQYFGTVEGAKTRIHTADAFEFFTPARGLYDAIYLDAFLRAPEDTARLKTRAFLTTLREHLTPGGLVAFNLIQSDPRTTEDFATIREIFPAAVRFTVAKSGNLIVIAPRDDIVLNDAELHSRAAELDRSLALDFSLTEMAALRLE